MSANSWSKDAVYTVTNINMGGMMRDIPLIEIRFNYYFAEDFYLVGEELMKPITIIPTGQTQSGINFLALRFAGLIADLLIGMEHGGVRMIDVKEFSKKNLAEVKKQFDLDNSNAEIEQAKQFLRVKQDEIDACDREIKKYSKRKDELLFELKVFR